MGDWGRREVLKTGLAATMGAWGLTPGRLHLRTAAAPRERLLLDSGWRFHFGHASDPAQDFGFGQGHAFDKSGSFFRPVSRGNFDESTWQRVDLPHDWAVELPFVDFPGLYEWGFHPVGRDFPATTVGWYRKTFTLPASDAGRRISLEFDGVYRDAMVVLNGHLVTRNFSGYAPFRADVTDIVNVGTPNILIVRADASEREGWFYEGAGIYRHVWLVKTDPVHVAHWGTFITSEVGKGSSVVTVATEVDNESDKPVTCRVVQTLHDSAGKPVGSGRSAPVLIAPFDRATVKQRLPVVNPKLWSVETPNMYQAVTTVELAGAEIDRYETPFGIRTVHFDPNQGFFLNGKRVEIRGTCNHQDHAGVGSALPDRLQSYRIERLKEMGSNAYRTSHNPPTPELLDACDRLGMLVLDETRLFNSEDEGLSQLERMIRRDRNHPAIFAWSIANEEPTQGNDVGKRIASSMKRLVRKLDPTRQITEAMNGGWGRGLSAVVDVQGFNYGTAAAMDDFHAKFPTQPTMGTEVGSTVSTRGEYANDKVKGYVSAYDRNFPGWAATAENWWSTYAARPWVAGGFVWTGFDYRGEPTPYEWPCINSHFGIMDTCGFPKDNFFYYQAWWGDKPVLHLFPHWNWAGKEGQDIEVWVHSNLDHVELFLDNRSLGGTDVPRNGHVAWEVRYAPGVLEARGFKDGKQLLVSTRQTTGPSARIVLRPDRTKISADGEDVSVIEVQVVDAAGRVVPIANDTISFTVTGAGKLIGVGNGNPSSHESDKGTTRSAFNGLCCAIVQASREPGEIRIEAAGTGLGAGTAVVAAERATARPSIG